MTRARVLNVLFLALSIAAIGRCDQNGQASVDRGASPHSVGNYEIVQDMLALCEAKTGQLEKERLAEASARKDIEKKATQTVAQVSDLADKMAQCTSALTTANQQNSAMRDQVAALRAEVQKTEILEERLEKLQSAYTQLESVSGKGDADFDGKIKDLQHTIEKLSAERDESHKRASKLESSLKGMQKSHERSLQECQASQGKGSDELHADLSQKLETCSAELDKHAGTCEAQVQANLKDLNDAKKAHQAASEKLQELTKSSTDSKSVIDGLRSKLSAMEKDLTSARKEKEGAFDAGKKDKEDVLALRRKLQEMTEANDIIFGFSTMRTTWNKTLTVINGAKTVVITGLQQWMPDAIESARMYLLDAQAFIDPYLVTVGPHWKTATTFVSTQWGNVKQLYNQHAAEKVTETIMTVRNEVDKHATALNANIDTHVLSKMYEVAPETRKLIPAALADRVALLIYFILFFGLFYHASTFTLRHTVMRVLCCFTGRMCRRKKTGEPSAKKRKSITPQDGVKQEDSRKKSQQPQQQKSGSRSRNRQEDNKGK
eukprot:GHVU01168518.1.p1 GENE.GHVU01168518.1~~GHVU01168518.1.p1  ORF type:complete len:547 (-),score=89.65 GHVU01168518.1:284-1924(-)